MKGITVDMTGIVFFLLLTGVVFMVGSFFITERLSPSELNKITELSKDELGRIIDGALADAKSKVEESIEAQIDASSEQVERALEKETNEKIMAINSAVEVDLTGQVCADSVGMRSEYSDTVMENMNKTHNEIMFLYNMLNDKHTELTGLATDLQKIAANVKSIQEGMAKKKAAEPAPVPKPEPAAKKVETKEQEVPVLKKEEEPETEENHTGRILEMRKKGMQSVEIAKALGVGLGEVNLVLGLYKGDTDS